jgi:hypothetical protein
MPSVNSYDFGGYKYVGAPILQHIPFFAYSQ